MGLVLTRCTGESIVVEHAGERMRIDVDVRGPQVKLHFAAPRTFTVHRSEVQERVDAQDART